MHQAWTTGTATLQGEHYQVDGAIVRPLPLQQGGIPFWIAGGGEQKTLRIAAEYASYTNWSGAPDEFAAKSRVLEERCREAGTDFGRIVRSANYNCIVAPTEQEVEERIRALEAKVTPYLGAEKAASFVAEYRTENALAVGTPEQIVERLSRMRDAGLGYAIIYFPEDRDRPRRRGAAPPQGPPGAPVSGENGTSQHSSQERDRCSVHPAVVHKYSVADPARRLPALATVVEDEGVHVVLRQEDAQRLGLEFDWVGAWGSPSASTPRSSSRARRPRFGTRRWPTPASAATCSPGLRHDHLLVSAGSGGGGARAPRVAASGTVTVSTVYITRWYHWGMAEPASAPITQEQLALRPGRLGGISSAWLRRSPESDRTCSPPARR